MIKGNRIFSFLLIGIFSLLHTIAIAQDVTYSGRVVDSNGESIIGVNIIIKGTTQGTTTDFDGNFSFQPSDISESPVFVFSFIGYKSQELDASNTTVFNIVLVEDNEMLDEFIVVGYGIQRKVDLTGSVSSVEMDQIQTIPVPSLDQALQGKAAGVNVTQNTGAPGGGVAVRIRGGGSGNSSPLYVVDGVPTTNALDNLSVADIESVSVLKGASAAIYGSRANNGVILITTKRGASGETIVNFNTQIGIQRHGNLTEMVNKDKYVEMYNEAANNDNVFFEDDLLKRKLITPEYAATLHDVNHLEEIFRNAIIQDHNVSVSGANEKTNYFLSISHFGQEGIILNSDYKRTSGKLSISTEAADWLTVATNLNISSDENNIVGSSGDGYGGNGGSVVRYALFRTPAIPVYDEVGEFVDMPENPQFFGDGYNPVGLALNQDNVRKGTKIFGDINATIDFTNKLKMISTLGLDKGNYNQRRFNKTWGTNDRINNPNSLSVNDDYLLNWSFSSALTYTTTLADKHTLTGMLGTELIKGSSYYNSATERDFPDQNKNMLYQGNGQGEVSVNEDDTGYALTSFFARINYNFKDKYLASAVLRRDGSSRFNEDNRWGTFYSVSAGWRIDGESFFDNVYFVSLLKLRTSYGGLGNQEIGLYPYADQKASNYNYPFGDVMTDGYATSVYGNADVQWETSKQFDVGFDLGMFDSRLNISAEYFNKTVENMLTRELVPPSGGTIDPAWINKGKILYSGLEFELNYKQVIKDGVFSATGMFATLHNEVLDLDAPITGGRIDNGVYAKITEEGYGVGDFYLYEMEGIFQNELEIITHANQGNNIYPGDVMYKDQNGDGVINGDDRVHVGSSIPAFTYGLNLMVEYKDFDASLFFQGAYGNEIYYQVATDIEGFYRPFTVTERYYDERWVGEGTSNTQPRASWQAKSNNTKPSTRFLEDGSYLRLKNVTIGYTLSQEISKKIHINKMRIYAVGQNLLTFTKYPGLDPEMTVSDNSTDDGDMAAGIDWGTYPSAVSYSIGLQITF